MAGAAAAAAGAAAARPAAAQEVSIVCNYCRSYRPRAPRRSVNVHLIVAGGCEERRRCSARLGGGGGGGAGDIAAVQHGARVDDPALAEHLRAMAAQRQQDENARLENRRLLDENQAARKKARNK